LQLGRAGAHFHQAGAKQAPGFTKQQHSKGNGKKKW
jgi:hypothetical protein